MVRRESVGMELCEFRVGLVRAVKVCGLRPGLNAFKKIRKTSIFVKIASIFSKFWACVFKCGLRVGAGWKLGCGFYRFRCNQFPSLVQWQGWSRVVTTVE